MILHSRQPLQDIKAVKGRGENDILLVNDR